MNNNGTVSFCLDGQAQATVQTTVMNIDASNNINLFLDNLVGGGLGEYSDGSIASVRLYNAALDAPPVDTVPEPANLALMLAGLTGIGLKRLCARRAAQPL